MSFQSSPELRSEVVTACKVLHHFRIVEGFGHISVRLKDRMMITPRKALGLVTEDELVELDVDGKQVAGKGAPPLEWPLSVSISKDSAATPAAARRGITRAKSEGGKILSVREST